MSTQQYTTQGRFNYLNAQTESSLLRNGKVLTKRDADGSDGGFIGVNLEPLMVDVIDARDAQQAKTCERNGFELIDAPLTDSSLDFFDHAAVLQRYYPECERLVSAATGARAYAFDHNLRSAEGKSSNRRISGGQTVQGPAKVVHGDYTLVSAPQRLRDLGEPPKLNDTYRDLVPAGESLIDAAGLASAFAPDGRFAIINVWRNITLDPVQINPLALCDGQTVNSEDLVTFEIHYADRIGENYFAKHAAGHRFYYFPLLTRDEALLIKQWDSAGALARSQGQQPDSSEPDGPCTFSFHSAFDDPAAPADAPDRLSIEVRCMVIYP